MIFNSKYHIIRNYCYSHCNFNNNNLCLIHWHMSIQKFRFVKLEKGYNFFKFPQNINPKHSLYFLMSSDSFDFSVFFSFSAKSASFWVRHYFATFQKSVYQYLIVLPNIKFLHDIFQLFNSFFFRNCFWHIVSKISQKLMKFKDWMVLPVTMWKYIRNNRNHFVYYLYYIYYFKYSWWNSTSVFGISDILVLDNHSLFTHSYIDL